MLIPVIADHDTGWDVFIKAGRVLEIVDGKPRKVGKVWFLKTTLDTGEVVAEVTFDNPVTMWAVKAAPARLIPVFDKESGVVVALALEYGKFHRKADEERAA